MPKYYDVCQSEPYEDTYHMFRTTDKAFAEWYCYEHNKCTDNWMTYFVLDHHELKIVEPEYKLTFSFAFLPGTLELESSDAVPYPTEDTGFSPELGLILVNGSGTSYEMCLKVAQNAAVEMRNSYLNGCL